jgi:hypothetical protein
MTQFSLYSRSYCHLCDDMLEQLRAYLESDQDFKEKNLDFTIDVIDVDADEKLVALYDELVPVLTAKKPGWQEVQICHYFLDINKLKEFFNE